MRMAHRHDVITPAARPFQSRRRCTGNPTRWMWLLDRPRVQSYLLKPPEFALVLEALVAPSLENDLERLFHPLLPLLPRDIEHLIIQRGIAGTDAELQPATGYGVDHGVVFCALQR